MLTNEFDTVRSPSSEQVMARIFRASPTQARDIGLTLPLPERARLALFCYARTHLRELGRTIAGTCDADSLASEGGPGGAALYQQRDAVPDDVQVSVQRPGMRRITVAPLSLAE